MIKVLLFADLQETVGKEFITFEENELTVTALRTEIKNSYQYTQIDNAMVAINEEFAREDEIIKTGDIVAIIPPISGG
ncbi:MoaD/ThiS family protein [Saliterribacillus persicus]|uniref:Molybdopterin synthase sulfur carrier subunit n=1 Tax=Saliterribacillus persicus TaxID=930114 RepID=A0A368XLP2_9BACI|nr:MoaD/ThiS family protein [Saliterribacillus persicus]RCW66954.1 molybdopterin synthase subunit MoaD [Saliterribacillus persicus]